MFVLGVTEIEFICWVWGRGDSVIVRVDLWALLCLSIIVQAWALIVQLLIFFLCRPPTSRNISSIWISAGSQWYQELIWKRFKLFSSELKSICICMSIWHHVKFDWPPDFSVLGNDPLTDDESNHDINSVAGVLKLYFRGLENPLFPKERFNDLLACISKNLHLNSFYTDHISPM